MHYMTMIPNEVIDVYLRSLQPGELKVLLVVLRKTLGYVDRGTKRKQIDWISHSQLMRITGCSRRTLSTAINGLTQRQLIEVRNIQGELLRTGRDRQLATRLYFQPTLRTGDNVGKAWGKASLGGQFFPST